MALRIIKYFKDLFDAPAPSAGKYLRWNPGATALENAAISAEPHPYISPNNFTFTTYLDAVADLGCDPTGVADCSAIIQAAIYANLSATLPNPGVRYIAGPHIYFPPGKYQFNSTVNLAAYYDTTNKYGLGINLWYDIYSVGISGAGTGAGGTFLYFNTGGTGPGIYMCAGLQLYGLSFYPGDANPYVWDDTAITYMAAPHPNSYFRNLGACRWEHVYMAGGTQATVDFRAGHWCGNIDFENCGFDNYIPDTGKSMLFDCSDNWVYSIRFRHSYFYSDGDSVTFLDTRNDEIEFLHCWFSYGTNGKSAGSAQIKFNGGGSVYIRNVDETGLGALANATSMFLNGGGNVSYPLKVIVEGSIFDRTQGTILALDRVSGGFATGITKIGAATLITKTANTTFVYEDGGYVDAKRVMLDIAVHPNAYFYNSADGYIRTPGYFGAAVVAAGGDVGHGVSSAFVGPGGYAARVKGNGSDGATAVGVITDTPVTWTVAGSKLLSIRNNTVEKAYFTKDGALEILGPAVTEKAIGLPAGTRIYIGTGFIYDDGGNFAVSTTFTAGGGVYMASGVLSRGGYRCEVQGREPDGATAIGVVANCVPALTTSGSKLLSIQNNSVEKAYFDKDGVLVAGGINLVAAAGTAYFYNVDVANSLTTGNLFLKYASQAIYAYDTDSLRLFGRCSNGATAVGVILDNNSYSLSTAGAKLVSIRNANSEKAFIDKDGGFAVASIQTFSAAALTLTSTVADGASAVGFIANTANTLANSSAKLFSIRNNTTEKAYFDINGTLWCNGLALTGSGYINADNYSVVGDTYATHIGGQSTDNASALGHVIRTQYSYTTAGAKIVSFRNNTTEKAFIDKDGGYVTTTGRISSAHFAPTYSASITIDATTGNFFTITATNSTAFTINAPTNPSAGQRMTIRIKNTSGGALGTITWNAAFKMATFTSPATANSRSVTFEYDGTNWIETARAASDIPN